MKHVFYGPVLGLAVALVSGSAFAQNPTALVSVRAGSGEVQVKGATLQAGQSIGASAGDAITVNGGEALVTYGNGCTVTVTGSYTVPAQAPKDCPSDAKPRSHVSGTAIAVGVGVAAAAAAVGGGGGDDGDDQSSSPDQPSSP